MTKFIKTGLILIVFSLLQKQSLNAKNLTIHSTTRLENFELLDIYLHDSLAFIPGGLGGLNIVNIANPESPRVISTYHATGCDWGRIYSWAVSGEFAYGAGRECGIHVVDISDISHPRFQGVYTDGLEPDFRYEHTEIKGSSMFLSRHQGGVEVVDISLPHSPTHITSVPSRNAWASLATDSLLFVADGGWGLKIYSIANRNDPQRLASLQTSGTAKDVALVGDFLFVAVGAAGVDMIDVSDPWTPIIVDNFNTSGYASRVSASGNRVAVSDWDDIEVLAYDTQGLSLIGYKNTGGRVMAIEMVGDMIYSAEWRDFKILEYGEISGPDVDFNTRKLEFPRVMERDSHELSLRLQNNGRERLRILDVFLDISDFEYELGSQTIDPDSTTSISIVYRPDLGGWSEQLMLTTNDQDEPVISITLTGNNPNGPMVGDIAPDFELESINGFGTIGTEELRGQPVVLAFFTSW